MSPPAQSYPVKIERLEWDSDFWGVRVGRATLEDLAIVQSIQDYDVLYLLVPIDRMDVARQAVELGFRLVDVRVQFELEPVPAISEIYWYEPADLPGVTALARRSFRGTRFYNDPRFDDRRCDDLYAAWVSSSVADETTGVFVAHVDGKVAGFATLTAENELGLIAVDEAFRRRGIAGSLMRDVLNAAYYRAPSKSLTVVTQGGNLPAQRLFQSVGGRTSSVGLWMHKWYS